MAQPTDEPVGLVLSVDGDLHTKELQKPLAALVGRTPIINFDTALGIAKNYVDEHHIDISDKFLQSMTLERRPDRPDKFWRASWELALPDSQPHKGGQLFIDVAMDKSVTIGLGE